MNESITIDRGNWECLCGNTAGDDGFYACDDQGNELSPADKKWDGDKYVCIKCGRIISESTARVLNKINPDAIERLIEI